MHEMKNIGLSSLDVVVLLSHRGAVLSAYSVEFTRLTSVKPGNHKREFGVPYQLFVEECRGRSQPRINELLAAFG